MQPLGKILPLLAATEDPSVDLAIAAAIPTADPDSQELLTLALLGRRNDDGKAGLISSFHLLSPKAQNLVITHTHRLDQAIRSSAASPDPQLVYNAFAVIAAAKDTRLAYLIHQRLVHGSDDVKKHAAQQLLDMARWAAPLTTHESPGCDGQTAHHLQIAIEDSLRDFLAHRQPAVFLALLILMPRAMPLALRYLGNPRSHVADLARATLAQTEHPLIRRSLLLLLPVSTLTETCLRALTGLREPQTLAQVLEVSHVLLHHGIAHKLAKISAGDSLSWLHDRTPTLPAGTAQGLPRWIMALPMEREQRLACLCHLGKQPDSLTRLSALRSLITLSCNDPAAGDTRPPTAALESGTPPTNPLEAIATFCTDDDPVSTRIALRHLIRREWPGLPQLLTRLINSPHDAVRTLVGQRLGPIGFQRMWDAWPKLEQLQRLTAGRALIKIDKSFHKQLSDKLAFPDHDGRLRAMSIIHGLNQGVLFEEALLTLANDPDAVTASAAVRALGSVDSPRVVGILETALSHANNRVRANAVEALHQLDSTTHVHKLVEMANSDDNRPRANAIAALMQMRTTEAMTALTNMLADHRPPQRASALWLVESLGLFSLARQVAEMSITDPDHDIQQRASNAIRQLVRSITPASDAPSMPEQIQSADAAAPQTPSTAA